ncbi:hypothetical protein QIA17_00360 (plasmid) [Borreliella californiensis]|uniref:Lipoprotein n=1 Tax=Borreliella californiensis TaxID=373543 RepID=A0A7W9ZLR6_9SPIR|nr:hypothetical protein [Borreliella californiensis]MBB6213386.1 hypothetical protein [Borreliella californiensis]MBB6213455.1 hypothetical protein [Borreliella californiensis]WKC91292.1 hypothetical protein QIA17_00360 [Borreliella californiensis]WNY70951.1 hypothetical protein QIA39_04605 [Borreliella californiensis]
MKRYIYVYIFAVIASSCYLNDFSSMKKSNSNNKYDLNFSKLSLSERESAILKIQRKFKSLTDKINSRITNYNEIKVSNFFSEFSEQKINLLNKILEILKVQHGLMEKSSSSLSKLNMLSGGSYAVHDPQPELKLLNQKYSDIDEKLREICSCILSNSVDFDKALKDLISLKEGSLVLIQK